MRPALMFRFTSVVLAPVLFACTSDSRGTALDAGVADAAATVTAPMGTPRTLVSLGGFLSDGGGPSWLALSDDHVFVSVVRSRAAGPALLRVPKAGGAATPIGEAATHGAGVAIVGDTVVWAQGNEIWKASLDGKDAQRLNAMAGDAIFPVMSDGMRVLFALAPIGDSGELRAYSADAGTVTLATGLNRPMALASRGSEIFVACLGPGRTASQEAEVLAFTNDGASRRVVADKQEGARGVVVDDDFVYWTTDGAPGGSGGDVVAGTGAVHRAPRAGGAAVALATGQDQPWGMAHDADYVYWVVEGSSGKRGAIRRTSKRGGGAVESLAEHQGRPRFVAVDGRSVYWTNFETGEVMALDL